MKVYRGYNKDYPNLGVRPEQNHIWATDDLEYAFEYAKLFENGGVVELELDDNKIKSANQYDYASIIDDEFGGDPIDADNSTCQKIIDEGYNFLIFDDMDKDIYLILDKSLIINVKEIDVIENQINEVLKFAGVELTETVAPMVLYHATDLVAAEKIIKDNEIQGATENWFEEQEKLMYGVSTSRSFKEAQFYISASALVPSSLNDDGTYFDREAHVRTNGYAVFVLDYRKLKQTHRIIPYNWFANNESDEYFSKGEMEEFVIGDIKPLTKYLTKVMFFDNSGKLIKEKAFNNGKQINEELVYADKNEDGYLINEVFKNPSKLEIEKYNLSQTRVVIDGEGNFYFCLAGVLTHDNIIDKIGKGDNYSLFYDYYKNTFYKRDEYRNEEEHKLMNNELKKWLLNYPYIKENFGTNFNTFIFTNIEEPFNINLNKINEELKLADEEPFNIDNMAEDIMSYDYFEDIEQAKEVIQNNIKELNNMGDIIKVYRAISVNFNPNEFINYLKNTNRPLGIYWADNYSSAKPYDGKGKYTYVLEALVNKTNIDFEGSIYTRSLYPENEIRLEIGSNIKLNNVYYNNKPLEINLIKNKQFKV